MVVIPPAPAPPRDWSLGAVAQERWLPEEPGQQRQSRPQPRAGGVRSSDFPKAQSWDVPERARLPLFRCRCSILGLVSVELLRLLAARTFPAPGGLEFTAQLLTSAANSLACVGSLPVFASQSLGLCINRRCLGSLLTLILTSSTCTWGAVLIDVFPGGGWRRLSGPPLLDEGAPGLIGFLGVWECLLLASVSLQMALCLSAWAFYRQFRELGLYPPEPRKGRVHAEVSTLEFVCEAEDVALLSDQCNGQCQREPQTWQGSCPDTVFPMAVAAEAPFSDLVAQRGFHRSGLHEDDVWYPST